MLFAPPEGAPMIRRRRRTTPPSFDPLEPRLLLATFTITTTADAGPGSLRQAIADSNTSAGVPDTIAFNIPGAGVQTIAPATQLPQIIDPVVIDGYTQPGSSLNTAALGSNAVLLIELTGRSLVTDTGAPG